MDHYWWISFFIYLVDWRIPRGDSPSGNSYKWSFMKTILAIFLSSFLLLGCSTVQQDILLTVKNPVYYNDMIISKLISVYDGDTFRCNLTSPKGLSKIISENISIRLDGIDTPEIRGSFQRLKSIALKARNHLATRLSNADVIILKDVKRGMYFRIIATIEIDGVNINHELIDLGYAKPYDGGSKRGLWDRRYKR